MGEERVSQSNPETAKADGVHVDHPRLVDAMRQAKKNGVPIEEAARRIGVPVEVLQKHYK